VFARGSVCACVGECVVLLLLFTLIMNTRLSVSAALRPVKPPYLTSLRVCVRVVHVCACERESVCVSSSCLLR
jgi:hypothetical protein